MKRRDFASRLLREIRYKAVEVVLVALVVAVVMWWFTRTIGAQMAEQNAKLQQQIKEAAKKKS